LAAGRSQPPRSTMRARKSGCEPLFRRPAGQADLPGRRTRSELQIGREERLGWRGVDPVLQVRPVAAITERPGVERDERVAMEQRPPESPKQTPAVIFKNRSGKASCAGIELTCG
jgi:hypothetical protein